MMRRIRLLLFVCALSACKVVVVAPDHGAVVSGDLTFFCLPGERCEIDFAHFTTDMRLQVIAEPGCMFERWNDVPSYLCSGFTDPVCRLSTNNLDPQNTDHLAMLDSEHVFYVGAVVVDPDGPDPSIVLFDGQVFDR